MVNDFKNIMLNLSTDVFVVVDRKGFVLDYNDKALPLLGKLKGANINNIMKPYLYDVLGTYSKRLDEKELPVNFVLNIKRRLYDCKIFPYSFGYVFYFDDITELKRYSEAINDFVKRIDLTQQVSRIGYFEMSLDFNEVRFSKEIYKILKAKNSDRGNLILKNLHEKDMKKYERAFNKLKTDGKDIEVNLRFVNKNNSDVLYGIVKASVLCEDRCRIVGTLQDITSLAEEQKKLKLAKKRAESVSKARLYFIGQASHDLRQPLQAMRMSLHSLDKEKMTPKQKKAINNIVSSAENLNYYLDNLIDISKLDYQGEKYSPYEFNVKELVDKIVNEFSLIAKDKNLEFNVNVENANIYSSPFFIERIIRNLLSNAFKYTRNQISLNLSITEGDLVISVIDNGIGISKKDMKYIFTEFFQGRHKGIKKDGIGLGLPIVKKMLNLLDGDIKVISTPNVGSDFVVSIPLIKKG